jgi:bacterioferritin (cytochrome b1)
MEATERELRELWLLNLYRNSELHGALLMGRLARTLGGAELPVHLTRHCATEARHAAMLTETIAALGGAFEPRGTTIQEHYSASGGVPAAVVDLLVLSEVLERRVLATYRSHLAEGGVHPLVASCLRAILREMEEEEGDEHAGWIDRALGTLPPDEVAAAERKWRAIDEAVAAELTALVRAKFPGAAP